MHYDDLAPMATMADAHREWHLNAGVPMGTPGCPQDACHPMDDEDYGPQEPWVTITCADCREKHHGTREDVHASIRGCGMLRRAARRQSWDRALDRALLAA